VSGVICTPNDATNAGMDSVDHTQGVYDRPGGVTHWDE
jgi:hypothetical protein